MTETELKKIEELKKPFGFLAVSALRSMRESQALKDLGVENVVISEAKRSLSTQMAYYSRGRMDVADVKKMYKAAGLYELSDSEAKTKNTWTLQSKHLEGLAIDFAPVKNGKIWWTAPEAVWQEMGRIGKECGLAWGGDWKDTKDTPHFENRENN